MSQLLACMIVAIMPLGFVFGMDKGRRDSQVVQLYRHKQRSCLSRDHMALLSAVTDDDVDTVCLLLEQIKPNHTIPDVMQPLDWVATDTVCNRIVTPSRGEIVAQFLHAGASLSSMSTLVHEAFLHIAAVHWQREDVVAGLLARGVEPRKCFQNGEFPILSDLALFNAPVHVAQELIVAGGADPNEAPKPDLNLERIYDTPLHYAALLRRDLLVLLYLACGASPNARGRCGWTPLHAAAAGGLAPVVRYLLCAGARLDVCDNGGNTPLHTASKSGCSDCIREMLLSCNRSVRQERMRLLDITNCAGMQPLHLALMHSRLGAVSALLDFKASLSDAMPIQECRPLHIAAERGWRDIVLQMLDDGADPNVCNARMMTPLHSAAGAKQLATVKLLLEAGADPMLLDCLKRKPLWYAQEADSPRVAGLLLAWAGEAVSPLVDGCCGLCGLFPARGVGLKRPRYATCKHRFCSDCISQAIKDGSCERCMFCCLDIEKH